MRYGVAVCWLVATTAGAEEVHFSREVQPLLAQKCLLCHGPDKQEGGLRLDRRDSALATLESGSRAIVPEKPGESELLSRVTSPDPDLRMPPQGEPLTAEDIKQLERWINAGAEYATHWAYRPLAQTPLPEVKHTAWVRNPIDQFVLGRLEAEGVEPSPAADRYTLIKRLYSDLLGLTPTLAEVDQFINDQSPDALEKLVDRLLASEHFGERWGRHWLDKARYADSDGYEKDNPRPTAWKYRDWVIRAINEDVPFDRFTTLQLAGDLLPEPDEQTRLATAFNRQTLTNTEGGTDQEQWRVAAVMDRTETLGQVWLGLSVGCARCHSHKYDQITQREYYRLYAFFNNGDETNADLLIEPERVREYEEQSKTHQQAVKDLTDKIEAAKKAKQETKELDQQLGELRKQAPRSPYLTVAVISQRSSNPRKTHILHRGEFKQPGEEVTPGTFSTLPSPGEQQSRLDLARWLMDGTNPLVPRVIVNEIWGHLFGAGLVRTPNDFGVRGDLPTHPELLDWLAAKSIELGWSRKQLIKTIVLSATYQQSSAHRPELAQRDPQNLWLSRQNRFRAEAEIIRDIALCSSGLLSRKVGGPSVFPPMPADVAELSYAGNFKWTTSQGEDRYRRGMYTFFKRTAPHPNLTTFDCPDSNVTCITRERSNTPLAALALLNNELFVESAQALARTVLSEPEQTSQQRLTTAFRRCLVRLPESWERETLEQYRQQSLTYYQSHPGEANQLVGEYAVAQVPPAENAAWILTMRMLLNLDEFITRE